MANSICLAAFALSSSILGTSSWKSPRCQPQKMPLPKVAKIYGIGPLGSNFTLQDAKLVAMGEGDCSQVQWHLSLGGKQFGKCSWLLNFYAWWTVASC